MPNGCQVSYNDSYISQILDLINNARANNGLPGLSLQDPLSAAATAHSQDMACNNFTSHTGSDGSSWYDRIRAQRYNDAYASENIYYGSPSFGGDAQGAFDWWWNSPVHKANILNPTITEIGIGYVFNSNSSYGGYYTVDFAKPK